MILSGAIRELRMLIDRAVATHATALYFVAPHHAVSVSSIGEYSYFRCSIFFSHTAVLTRSEMEELQKFFKRAWNHRNQRPNSPFYNLVFEHVKITENQIQFDQNTDFTFEYETNFVPVDQVSAWDEKVKTFAISSVMPDRPYLKIKPSIINNLYLSLRSYVVDKIQDHSHENVNTLVSKDSVLYFLRDSRRDHSKYVTGGKHTRFTEGFAIYKEFENVPFFIYDLDIITFRKMCRLTMIENIIMVPFENFYIIEGHGEELMCKFHMRLRV